MSLFLLFIIIYYLLFIISIIYVFIFMSLFLSQDCRVCFLYRDFLFLEGFSVPVTRYTDFDHFMVIFVGGHL
jgi:hypothetical protein